jgi:hypothetical protein
VDLGHVSEVFREPIRGFHDLLRQKSISIASLTMRFTCLVFVARVKELWAIECSVPDRYCDIVTSRI